MIGINDVVEKLADDVFVQGIDPSQSFKPMTDNELTIEQQQGIAGGAAYVKNKLERSVQRRAIRNPKIVEIIGVLVGL